MNDLLLKDAAIFKSEGRALPVETAVKLLNYYDYLAHDKKKARKMANYVISQDAGTNSFYYQKAKIWIELN